MGIKQSFISELKNEASLTRKMLERVPLEQKEWTPHAKSMTLGRLATHVAENFKWVNRINDAAEFDFASNPFKPHVASTQEELLKIFDTNLDNAMASLDKATEESLEQNWVVRSGDQVMGTTIKKDAIRGWAISHHIHHRGQLSVYLRLLDIQVPGMYGPSADEKL